MKHEERTATTLVLLFLVMACSASGFAGPMAEREETAEHGSSEVQEKIVPSFSDPKEEAAVYVFLAWIWLVILVLIVILRWKIKEADRLHRAGFFDQKKRMDIPLVEQGNTEDVP